jgi:pumilio family protein 6
MHVCIIHYYVRLSLTCKISCFFSVQSFKGSLPKLAVHSVGARVVESLFLNFPPSTTIQLKQEFYGPHYNLFAADLKGVPTLKSVIESAKTDTQKESALKFVKDIVNKGITKSFFGYKYFQDILAEYLDVAEPNEIRSGISSSLVDHSIHLLSTRAGAKVVAICASYATPKDRKRICKSLKGYTRSSLLHRDAYIAILRLVQVTDDTVSIHKSILNELLTTADKKDEQQQSSSSPLLDLALSETASKMFLLMLLDDDEKRNKYFDPSEQSILCVESFVTENGKKVPTSKKDPTQRRKELLQHVVDELNKLCVTHAEELLRSLPGSRVIKEVYANNTTNTEVVEALVNACEAALEESDKSSDDDEKKFTLFEDPVGHRAVKNIFLCDASSEEPAFSKAFVDRLGDRLMDVAKSNRGAFVVAALLKVPQVKKQAQKKLNKKELTKLSIGKGVTSGFKALLAEIA